MYKFECANIKVCMCTLKWNLLKTFKWMKVWTCLHLTFIHPSIVPYIHWSIDSFIHPSIVPYIHSSIHSSIHSFTHPFIVPYINWSIHSYILLSLHLSIHSSSGGNFEDLRVSYSIKPIYPPALDRFSSPVDNISPPGKYLAFTYVMQHMNE